MGAGEASQRPAGVTTYRPARASLNLALVALLFTTLLTSVPAAVEAETVGAPGTLDETFDDDGIAITEISSFVEARDTARQVVDGGEEYVLVLERRGNAVWRFLPDGTLDTSWPSGAGSGVVDGDGVLPINTDPAFTPTRVAAGPDGSFVVAGWAGSDVGVRVARFLPGGALDTSFGVGGVARVLGFQQGVCATFPEGPSGPNLRLTFTDFSDVGVQSNGFVVIVGPGTIEEPSDGCLLSSHGALLAARFASNGTVDRVVGTEPANTSTAHGDRVPKSLAVMDDDRIVVSAATRQAATPQAPRVTVVRYLANLTLDNQFAFDGISTQSPTAFGETSDPFSSALPLAVHPEDNSVVVGVELTVETTGERRWRAMRWFGSGFFSFDGARVSVPPTDAPPRIRGTGVVDDGFVLVGEVQSSGQRSLGVARYSFEDDGYGAVLVGQFSVVGHPGPDGGPPQPVTGVTATGLVTLDDGLRIVGYAEPQVFGLDNHRQVLLSRLNSDGSFDATFGPAGNGFAQHNGRYGDFGRAVTVLPDGRIVAGGSIPVTGTIADPLTGFVLRHLDDGRHDPAFGPGDIRGIEITRYETAVGPTGFGPTALPAAAGPGAHQPPFGAVLAASEVTASAVVIDVENANDAGDGSFRAAVLAANTQTEPVTIRFQSAFDIVLTSGEVAYNGTEELTIEGNGSTITAEGASPEFGSQMRILRVTTDAVEALHLRDLTFRNGVPCPGSDCPGQIPATQERGGAVAAVTRVTLDNVTFEDNEAWDSEGGALFAAGDVNVRGSTFDGNRAGHGGAIWSNGNVTVTNSTFTNNVGNLFDSGGAIRAVGNVTISDNSVFMNNFSPLGGAVAAGGDVDVSDSLFHDNWAFDSTIPVDGDDDEDVPGDGGAIWSEGNVTVARSTFTMNEADSDGGAIWSGGNVRITDQSTFEDNAAHLHGGAVWAAGTAAVSDSTFTENIAHGSGVGGAIRAANNVTSTRSEFDGNNANSQGGALWSDGDVTVIGSTFTGNIAFLDKDPGVDVFGGGAIRAAGQGRIEDSTFEDNESNDRGGAVWVLGQGVPEGEVALTIHSSTFDANSVETSTGLLGGGAVAVDGDMHIEASTFVRNSAVFGGAVWASVSSSVTAVNATFTGNTAAQEGGAIYLPAGDDNRVTLTYVTIAGNSGSQQVGVELGVLESFGSVIARPSGRNCEAEDTISSYSYDTDGSCGFEGEGDISQGPDPGLGELADNGGPTLTMEPEGNQLVDRIRRDDCLEADISVDQRGSPRPSPAGGDCDIGAVEVVQLAPRMDIEVEGLDHDDQERVIIVGSTAFGNVGAVHRLLPDGGSDPSFNGGFPVTYDFDSCCGTVFNDVVIDQQGRIVAVGSTHHVNGNNDDAIVVLRLLPDGSPDPSFGDDPNDPGVVFIHHLQNPDRVSAAGVTLDAGRIVITGAAAEDLSDFRPLRLLVARLMEDGSRDATFGSGSDLGDGVVLLELGDFLVDPGEVTIFDLVGTDVAVSGDRLGGGEIGGIVVTGMVQFAAFGFCPPVAVIGCPGGEGFVLQVGFVAQLTSSGGPDPAFSGREDVVGLTLPFFDRFGFAQPTVANGVAIDPAGGIVVAGGVLSDNPGAMLLARIRPDGQNDPRFGVDGDGVVVTDDLAGSSIANDVAMAPDGKIVVTGTVTDDRGSRVLVARYNPGVGSLVCEPLEIDFGLLPVGASNSSVVSCMAVGGQVTIGTITALGLHAADFVPTAEFCEGVTLPPGATCDFAVTFAPSATGVRSAGLLVVSNALNSPAAVRLRGEGGDLDGTLEAALFEVDPEEGPVESEFTGFGQRYLPGVEVEVSIAGLPITTVPAGEVGDDGSFTVDLFVPVGTPGGPQPVVACQRCGQVDEVVGSAVFEVTPRLFVRPELSRPGGVVDAFGDGFPAETPILLSWLPGLGTATTLSSVEGEISTPMLLLRRDILGPRELEARISGAPDVVATADFLAVPGSTQPGDFAIRR